jgi:serine acetyltransferase
MTLQAEMLRQIREDRRIDQAAAVAAAAVVARTVTDTAAVVEARRVAPHHDP